MDITYLAEVEEFRAEVRVVLAEELPSGWRGIGAVPDAAATREFVRAWRRTPHRRGLLSGAERWCQGFSEPGAGSDLAAVATRARLDGDEWVVDGQKIWTSGADRSTGIFVLARTDPEVPRHQGLSFLLVPLDQPGVDVRPIRHMAGGGEFCEVFFSGARTRRDLVIGPVGAGWEVARTLLAFERGEEAATNPLLFRAEIDRLLELARRTGRAADPVLRQRLARCYARVEVMSYLGYRIPSDVLACGELGHAASVSKLYWSEYRRVEQLVAGVAHRAGRNDLCRNVRGAAHDPRRTCARPAAGLTGSDFLRHNHTTTLTISGR
jgi:alkylation response protein AidB-like acyl-CoA dehydrogenase